MVRKKGTIYRTTQIKRAITDEEFKTLVNSFKFIKHKVLLRILRYEGFRLDEGLRINIFNKPHTNYLDLERGTIIFNEQKNGNDGEVWYLRERTVRLLRKYLELYGDKIESNNGWLFWSTWSRRKGEHLQLRCIESLMHRTRKKLGWDNKIYGYKSNGYKKHIICFHSCKHEHHREVLRNMAKKWGRIDTISALMLTRHKSIQGLQPYINEVKEVKQSLVNELMN